MISSRCDEISREGADSAMTAPETGGQPQEWSDPNLLLLISLPIYL
jgi:hypothetical protein